MSDGEAAQTATLGAPGIGVDRTPHGSALSFRSVASVVLFGVGILVTAALAYGLLQLLPDQLLLRLFGHTVTIRSVHQRLISRIVVVLLVLPVALMIEFAAIGWSRSSLRELLFARSPTIKTDLAMFALGQTQILDVVGRVMMLGLGMVSAIWVRDRVHDMTGFAVDPSGLPFLVQLPLYFLIFSFFDYWTHRISHTPLFWPLHRYHHSAADFCTLTSDRQHPVAFLGLFLVNIPMALLGAQPVVMIYAVTLTNAFGYLAHSRMSSDWGVIGRWVIQAPLHHRLHHKLSMDEPTGHYSMVPLWDRLFGTWRGTPAADLPIGVSRPYRHGYWVIFDVLRDYFDFFRGLVGRPAEL